MLKMIEKQFAPLWTFLLPIYCKISIAKSDMTESLALVVIWVPMLNINST